TLYGGAAMGGVVSLDAARGRGPAAAEMELEGGSFSTWRGSIAAVGGTDRTGASVAITANGTDNQRHPNGWDQRTELARLDQRLLPGLSVGAAFFGHKQRFNSP